MIGRTSFRRPLTRGAVTLTILTVAVTAAPATAFAAARATARTAPALSATSGSVYLLQGLPGRSVDLYLNGQRVRTGVAAKTVVGPMSLAAGSYELKATTAGTNTVLLDRSFSVTSGHSIDAVVHLDSQANPTAKLTVFGNDMDAVNAGKARLSIAHTADVPPADIRVDGKVLFSNVANGEGLTTVVPAATYRVDVVPTGTSGPAVLGPADFTLQAGTLTRVFAIGDPALHTMDAIVQALPVRVAKAGDPTGIDTGSGGRAGTPAVSSVGGLGLLALGLALFAGCLYRIRRRPVRSEAP